MAIHLWSRCGKPGPFCWEPQKLTRTWGPSLSPEAGWLHPERSMWHFTRALSSSPGRRPAGLLWEQRSRPGARTWAGLARQRHSSPS